MRVCVLTTSYPRSEREIGGAFVASAVAELRRRGVEVDVVGPGDFRAFGFGADAGIPSTLRSQRWRALLLLPAFLLSFRRAAARVAGGADVVPAHWLGGG